MLEDPELAAELGSNARQYVMKELSWEKTAEKVEEVYRRVLEYTNPNL